MSRNSKQSIGGTLILILFGIIALFGGVEALVVLIPAALLVWYGAGAILRSDRS
ncbi:MAG: hypothetical protein ABSA78_04850 [Candidatus Sulfotelmatobacter sp.]|jgi:hypothetical protein